MNNYYYISTKNNNDYNYGVIIPVMMNVKLFMIFLECYITILTTHAGSLLEKEGQTDSYSSGGGEVTCLKSAMYLYRIIAVASIFAACL